MTPGPDDIRRMADCVKLAREWKNRAILWPATWQQCDHVARELDQRITMGWTPMGPVEVEILRGIIDILLQGPTLEIRVPAPPGPETLARLREFLAQPVPDAPEVVL